jgi:hypothetical protein
MRITVTNLGELTFTLEVPEDLELENFKAFCEVESGLLGKNSNFVNKLLKINASHEYEVNVTYSDIAFSFFFFQPTKLRYFSTASYLQTTKRD